MSLCGCGVRGARPSGTWARTHSEAASQGVCGFGNSHPGAPFAKIRDGLEDFRRAAVGRRTEEKEKLVEDLSVFLKDSRRHLPDPQLELQGTDLPGHHRCCLSARFVEFPPEAGYGTRTHTIVLVDGNDRVTYHEQTRIDEDNWECSVYEFTLE